MAEEEKAVPISTVLKVQEIERTLTEAAATYVATWDRGGLHRHLYHGVPA